jgi:hypothetical protein
MISSSVPERQAPRKSQGRGADIFNLISTYYLIALSSASTILLGIRGSSTVHSQTTALWNADLFLCVWD